MYTNRVFGTAKCVLFIEVSPFQGVLTYIGTIYVGTYVCTYTYTEMCGMIVVQCG